MSTKQDDPLAWLLIIILFIGFISWSIRYDAGIYRGFEAFIWFIVHMSVAWAISRGLIYIIKKE